jgi:hypothetical protein
MSTNRTLHVIPETDEIANAITTAAKLWPELEKHPALLLGQILELGVQNMERLTINMNCDRHETISKIAGTMNDTWPANWREELREDWPD